MLLIWLHGILLAHQNPVKHIYEDLVDAGFRPLAGKLCPLCGSAVPAAAGGGTVAELRDNLCLPGNLLWLGKGVKLLEEEFRCKVRFLKEDKNAQTLLPSLVLQTPLKCD